MFEDQEILEIVEKTIARRRAEASATHAGASPNLPAEIGLSFHGRNLTVVIRVDFDAGFAVSDIRDIVGELTALGPAYNATWHGGEGWARREWPTGPDDEKFIGVLGVVRP